MRRTASSCQIGWVAVSRYYIGQLVYEADQHEVFRDLPMGTVVDIIPDGYIVRWDGQKTADQWPYDEWSLAELDPEVYAMNSGEGND